MVVFPSKSHQTVRTGMTARVLKSTVKFVAIGVGAITAHWVFSPRQFQGGGNATEAIIPISSIPYIVVIIGLAILLLEKKKKRVS